MSAVTGGVPPAFAQAPARVPVHRLNHVHPFRFRGGFGYYRFHARPLRYPPLQMSPPDENMPPPIIEPSPPLEDQSGGGTSLPHGFSLTVPVGDAAAAAPASLNRYVEVGRALGACWHPPAVGGWSAITLRVAFRRDGTIYGEPRIPVVEASADDTKSELAQSLTAALKTCTPLPFSPSLGAAIAGEIFAIRFTHQD